MAGMSDEMTYAELWAGAINDTYSDDDEEAYVTGAALDGESYDDAVRRILMKAARLLRGYDESATFTGEELDLVRYLMPAHEVHQSAAVAWVRERYGPEPDAQS
jgi:hypothetical protein